MSRAMRKHHRALLAALVVLPALLASGCSTLDTADVDGGIVAMRSGLDAAAPAERLPVRVGVLPVDAGEGYARYRRETNGNEGLHRWADEAGATETQRLRDRIVRTLDASQAFESVAAFDALPSAAATGLDDSGFDRAWRERFDLLIAPRLVRNDVAYVGSNGMWWPNFAIWGFVSPIASWWVADEEFEADVCVEIAAFAVGARAQVLKKEIAGKVQKTLDDWDQGWEWLSIFTTPSTLDAGNWKVIAPELRPHGELEMLRNLARYTRRDVASEASRTALMPQLLKQEAICAWARPAGWAQPRYVKEDAERVGAALRNPAGLAWRAVQVTVCGGESGARAQLKAAIESAGQRLHAHDRLLLYVAALGGFTKNGDAALVTGDPDAEGGLVTVAELAEWLGNVKASVLVVLDAGFSGDRRTRYAELGGKAGASPLEPLTKLGNVSVLSGVTRKSGALELRELSGGLLTHFLARVIESPATADRDSDGALSPMELQDACGAGVSRYAELEGVDQSAVYTGKASALKSAFLSPCAKPTESQPADNKEVASADSK